MFQNTKRAKSCCFFLQPTFLEALTKDRQSKIAHHITRNIIRIILSREKKSLKKETNIKDKMPSSIA
jgi:hypothetical protein